MRTKFILDFIRITEGVAAGKIDTGGNERLAEFGNDRQGDTIGRDADTDSLLFGGEDLRGLPRRFEDKGIRAGETALEDAKREVADLGKTGDGGKIRADESEGLFGSRALIR